MLVNYSNITDETEAHVTAIYNEEVEKVDCTPTKKEKRVEYVSCSSKTRTKIAKYAIDNRPTNRCSFQQNTSKKSD